MARGWHGATGQGIVRYVRAKPGYHLILVGLGDVDHAIDQAGYVVL